MQDQKDRSKGAVFTLKLEPELRNEFMAEAMSIDRPASQLVREFMRDFVTRRREAREYDEFLAEKVAEGRVALRAGHGIPNDEVEKEFAERRASLRRRAGLGL